MAAAAPPPAGVAPGSVPGVLDALAAGNVIEAIRLYRLATKTGLKDAKAAIERITGR